MRSKLAGLAFLMLLTLTSSCEQFGKLTVVDNVPKSLKEVSGITTVPGSKLLWMVNDQGNEPILYGWEPNGKIKRKLTVRGATKKSDFETLSSNSEFLFIGDTGNNDQNRRNLKILRVPLEDLTGDEERTVTNTSAIAYKFEDQDEFPADKKKSFNVEAMTVIGNCIYLFTKEQGKAFEGLTRVYTLQNEPGTQVATYSHSIPTCDDEDDCFITGATVTPQGDVILLAHNKYFLVRDFEDLRNSSVTKHKLDHSSQKEGVTYENGRLLITDERKKKSGGKLYALNL